MKNKIIKLISVFLAITMLFGIVKISVSAEITPEENDVYVAGTLVSGSEESYWLTVDGELTAENASAENYNVKYVPSTDSTNTKLVLNNAALSKAAEIDGLKSVIYSYAELVIELTGENTFSGGNIAIGAVKLSVEGNGNMTFNGSEDTQASVYSPLGVTISDSAKIDIIGYELTWTYGILSESGKVIIEEDAAVNIKLSGTGIYSAGLTVADDAQLTVDVANYDSYAVETCDGDVNISGNAVVNLSTTREVSGVYEERSTTSALHVYKGNLTVSGNARLNATSGGGYNSAAVWVRGSDSYKTASITVSDHAKINAKSGDTTASTHGIIVENASDSVFTVKDYAEVVAESGNEIKDENDSTNSTSGTTSGIDARKIVVSDNAVLKGIAGNRLENEENNEMNGNSFGIYSTELNVSGNAEITGVAGKGEESLGIVGGNATVSDECKITGVSDVAEDFSLGIIFSNAVINGNTEINAESDRAVTRDSIGLSVGGALDVSGNALINAKGGVVGTSNGICAGVCAGSAKIYGSAQINATTAPDDVYDHRNCHGFCVEDMLSINDNVKITASGNAEYTSSGISAGNVEINGSPSITATGKYSAIFIPDNYEITQSEDTDIFVSTDTNPENATEWDGENILISYFDGSERVVSPYKYVNIKPAVKSHTVTYYLTEGGDVYETKTFFEGEVMVHPEPSVQGYIFNGWVDENGNSLPETMGKEDIVAYAVTEPESYTLSFITEGSVYEEYTVTYGSEITMPENPALEGFNFLGWSTDSDATSAEYVSGNSIIVTEDTVLYAVWSKIAYTLSYDANGGSGTPDEQTGDVIYTIGIIVPFRSGHNFLGWSTNSSATSVEYVPGDSITLTADTVLYAVWAKTSYFLAKNDIFSFVNSRRNFQTGTYTMKDDDFIKLTNYIRNMYSAKRAETFINRLQVARANTWGGSCFGMSMSVILNKTGQIDFVNNFDPAAADMYGVSRPYQNEDVQSAINYYQISQRVNAFRTTTYTTDKGNFSTGLEKLVNTVKDGNMTLLIYSWPEGCHAIVLVGYEKAEGGHNLIAYDNRYGSDYINVYIDEEYTTCTVNGTEEAYYVEFNTDFSIFDKIDIDGSNNDMVFECAASDSESIGTEIGVKLNGNIIIKNAVGETLTIKDGVIGGDMDVLSSYMIVNSTVDDFSVPGTLMLEVEDSDSFTFESTAEEITASLATEDYYAEVTAEADKVIISEDEGIYTAGNDVEFNGWLSLNNDMGDVIGFDGQGDGDINLLYGNDGEILVEGANDEGTITVYSNLVDIDTVTFNSDYETLKVSEKAGNIAITASSKNDGVFDVKVAEIINTEPTLAIVNPSTTKIGYGDSIVLHANTDIDLPIGYYIVWTAGNSNFRYSVSDDGKTCTITPSSSGDTTFTATVYDETGNAVSTDEQVMTSKAGIFDKIIAFFKKHFGLTKIIPQNHKGTF